MFEIQFLKIQIVPTDSEPAKFCSDRCLAMSRAIARQLEDFVSLKMEKGGEERNGESDGRREEKKHFTIPKEEEHWAPFLVEEVKSVKEKRKDEKRA